MKRLVSAAALSMMLAGAALAQAPAPAGDVQPAQSGTEATAPPVSTEAQVVAPREAPAPSAAESQTETTMPSASSETNEPSPTQTGSIPQPGSPTSARADGGQATPPAATEHAAAPDSIEACIASAAELGSTAERQQLTPEHADRLDALFSKMETLCDGEQFAEAVAVADDIRSLIKPN